MEARDIVEHMYKNDPFSQWLGISLDEIAPGKVELGMKVREEMCNGFGIAHGGICYSFADSALAFAANTRAKKSFSIESSIQYYKAIQLGDELKAVSRELVLSDDSAVYEIIVSKEELVLAKFNGTVYRGEKWEI